MDMIIVLQLLGGVGLFLFGMNLMGSYLTQLAGSKLEQTLQRLTTSRRRGIGFLKGWALGAAVTAIIQSSAATTIMLTGFVNAGIMKLTQAIPVVMGANVGSTVTAQILRLGDLSSDLLLFRLLKPSAFAPMLVGVGALIHLLAKGKKIKHTAGILVGLGLLFYGMTMMEEVFAPLRESARFRALFTSFENPLLGILMGLVVTALIQSSSASVGILQALAATGAITYETAIPILLGQNIGKCVTVLLGSIGAKKEAKRVGLGYLLFNLTGVLLFAGIIYSIYYTVGIPWFGRAVNRGIIANLHLAFNLITSLLLLPFSEKISQLTGRLLGQEQTDPSQLAFSRLDELLLNTPTVALDQCWDLMGQMSRRISENYRWAMELLHDYRPELLPKLEENEQFIDRCETVLSSYIIRIDRKRLSPGQRRMVSEMLNCISDFERIGDYSINIAYVSREMQESSVTFSEAGAQEVETIASAAAYAMETLWNAFARNSSVLAVRIEPLADVIEMLTETIKTHHIRRLTDGQCSVQAGVALYDLLNCFERIGAHAANISLHIIGRNQPDQPFDEMHGHAVDQSSEEYQALLHYYRTQYLLPLEEGQSQT